MIFYLPLTFIAFCQRGAYQQFIKIQHINRNIKFIENMSQVGENLQQNKIDPIQSPQKKSEQGNKSINPSKQKSQRSSQKQNQNINEGSHKSKQPSMKSGNKKQVSQRQWSAVYENENFGIDLHNLNKEAVFKKKDEKIQASDKNSQQQIQWEAAYIDEKFYLSDPASLAKLRELENQIEIEKQKLINIEVAERFDKSFLSQRPINSSGQNEQLEVLTEINDSILFQRKEHAEQDLLNEQQKYRNKIDEMKKKKSILKKQIGCGTNDKNLQANASEILKNQEQATKQKVDKEKASKVEKSQKVSEKKQQDGLRKSASAQVENLAKKSEKDIKVSQKAESQKKSVKQEDEKPLEKQKSRKSSKQKVPSTTQQINLPQLPTNLKYTADGVSQTPKKTEKSAINKQQAIQKSQKTSKVQQNMESPLQKLEKNPSEKNSTSKSRKIESQKKSQAQQRKSVSKKQQKNQPSNKSVKNQQDQDLLKSQNKSQVKTPSQAGKLQNGEKSLNNRQEKSVKVQKSNKSEVKQVSEKHSPSVVEKSIQQKPQKSIRIQKSSKGEAKQPSENKSPSVVQKSIPETPQKSIKVQKSSKSEAKQPSEKHSPSVADKSNQQKVQKSVRREDKQEKQKSKKSALIKQSSPSQHKSQNTKKDVSQHKQPSHVSQQQKKSSLPSLPPEIRINGEAFRKTDKSVQWEQIEIESKSKYNVVENKLEEKELSQHSKVEKSEKQPSQHSQHSQQNIETKSKKSHKIEEKSKAQSVYKQYQNESRVISESPSQNKDAISYKSKQPSQVSKSNKNEKSEKSAVQEASNQQKSVRQSQVENKTVKSSKHEVLSKKQQQNLEQSRKLFSEKQPSEIKASNREISEKQKNYQSEQKLQNDIGSEKKKTSFKIHSRESSVKSKRSSSRPSSYQRQQLSQHSKVISNINKKKFQPDQSQLRQRNSSVTQLQIKNLHLHIAQLQEKLKKVEQKQEQMVRFQNNQSNIMSEVQASHAASGSQPVSPIGKFNLNSRLKLQAKLTLQGSTVHFNTYEEQMKKTAEDNQKLQKLKLQEQIGRLKKIIRDMQMQKIKSIQYDPNQSLHKLEPRKNSFHDSQDINKEKFQQKWKDSLNSDLLLETKRHEWNTETLNKEDAGKIKKNSPGKFHIDSPRKYNRINAQKSKQFSQIAKDDQREQAPLPLRRKAESVHSAVHGATVHGTVRRDLAKSDLINKFEENQRNFNQFIESSRLLVQQPQSYVQIGSSTFPQHLQQKPIAQVVQAVQSPTKNSPAAQKQKQATQNFSQIVQKLKYENPEDQIKIPSQITIGNIVMPNLPETPNLSMSQDDFLELAKKTYLLFGITIDEKQNQLCMKKYKNCVVFTFGNSQQNTVLWHYSGKFYFGGWKNTNDPGQGQKIGQGLEYIPGKHIYKGQFLGGKKNGNGILKNANGNIYDGQWVQGIKNGRGVYFESSTGTYYSGQWKDGKRDGYGVLKFSNNQFYQGTFVKSIKQGYGVQKFANEDFYKGQYQKGKFHGKGKYCWANGSSYEGDFVDGCRHGQGTWRSSRKSGDIYIGGYQNDKKCGYGRYVWANGCVYEGYFRNDLKNGKGRLIYQDGKQIKGSWHDGNLVASDQQARKSQDHEEEPLRRSIRASSLRNAVNANPYRNPVHL